MLLIISFIVAILILILSVYFLYGRIMSNKEKISGVKHTPKILQVDTNIQTQKKSRKSKKSHKSVPNESGVVKTTEENINVTNQSTVDDFQIQENIIEPTRRIYEESLNTDVENLSSNDKIDIESLKNEIDNYETEIKTLNLKLEEANEKIASYKDEAESLKEEIKTIKARINNAELSKSKIEEQLKQAENSKTESLTKIVELERILAQNNAESTDLKQKVESLSQRLVKSEADLKSEQEKLKLLQKEKDELAKKLEEINEKNKTSNVDHINMYKQYETKIENLTAECKEVKYETVKLNSLLQEKDRSMDQLNEQIRQLSNKLENSKKENEIISRKLEKASRDLNEKLAEATEFNKNNRRLSDDLDNLKSEIENKQGFYESHLQQVSEELRQKNSNMQHFEEENLSLKEKIIRLDNELINKCEEIENLQKSNSDILMQMESLKTNFSLKTEEMQSKVQECLDKDARLNEIDRQNSQFKSEIERLRSENSANFEKIKEKSNLVEEIALLKSASNDKDDELNLKLNNALKELKEKSKDLTVLQDQKIDQLKTIEQLKKELCCKTDKVGELCNDLNRKDIVVKELLNEKKLLEAKLENAKMSPIAEKETQLQNSRITVQFEEVTKQLDTKINEIKKLENEKVQLMHTIDHMKTEMKRNEESTKLHIYDLQEKLDKKVHELNTEKDKYDALEQKLNDLVDSNTLQSNLTVEDDIQEIRMKPDFQTCETTILTSDSRTVEEMQSHINKIESELLALQRKYYDLKDNYESNQKTQQNINIYPSDTVSIPPITSEITSDTHIDKSQSHNHLLESIEKLNFEISEQRLKNQDLQKSFSDSYSEKNRLKSEYNQLSNDYETVKVKYDNLVKEFQVLKSSSQIHDTTETIILLEDQLKKCQDDNYQLKIQLENYRETLEKTENCLQNIQASVDQEENNWKICLKSSEQEQERLEEKIKELLNQIEDLRNQKHSDSSVMISMETPSIANGSLSSETKKKRKRKNKKKKNKNRVTQA